MANSSMGELIFFMRGNKVKSKRSLEIVRSKIRDEFQKELERPRRKRADNWTFNELLSRSTYKNNRKQSVSNDSLFDANVYSPHSCYDSVLSPISVCQDPASPQSIVEERLSEDEYHVPKLRPAKRKRNTFNRTNTLDLSETTPILDKSISKSEKLRSFEDSGIMTEEILITSTPIKSKRPRLECETSCISILPENQPISQFQEPTTSSILEDLKNEVLSCHESCQTSPPQSPVRTRTVSVSTELTGDLDGPIINIPDNSICKTESLYNSTQTTDLIDFDDKTSQTDPIEFKKRPEELKSTNAGSTWFQMISLTDPNDFAEKRKPRSIGIQTEVIPDAMLTRLNQIEKELLNSSEDESESEEELEGSTENDKKEEDSDEDLEDSEDYDSGSKSSKTSRSTKSSKKDESNMLTRATSSITNFFSLR